MQKQRLRVGELVRLNSGGTDMTVVSRHGGSRVTVRWNNNDGKAQEHTLPECCVYRLPGS